MVRRLDDLDGAADVGCLAVSDVQLRPSVARMYDHYLAGKDNLKVDRDAAEEVERAAPDLVRTARDNREFMHRVVGWCAESGLDQFIDVGTGIPTSPTPVEVAHRVRPNAVVVGVDNDPIVLAHARALGGMRVVAGDMCDTGAVIGEAGQWVDWDRPVAVLLIAVLHFVPDHDEAAGIVAAFVERLAPGSLVAISHVCSTGADPAAVRQVERVYQRSTAPGVFRTHEQILNLFGGLELVAPGLVPVQHWPEESGRRLTKLPALGGVGRVPGAVETAGGAGGQR